MANLLSGIIGSVIGAVIGVVAAERTMRRTREHERALASELASAQATKRIALALEFVYDAFTRVVDEGAHLTAQDRIGVPDELKSQVAQAVGEFARVVIVEGAVVPPSIEAQIQACRSAMREVVPTHVGPVKASVLSLRDQIRKLRTVLVYYQRNPSGCATKATA